MEPKYISVTNGLRTHNIEVITDAPEREVKTDFILEHMNTDFHKAVLLDKKPYSVSLTANYEWLESEFKSNEEIKNVDTAILNSVLTANMLYELDFVQAKGIYKPTRNFIMDKLGSTFMDGMMEHLPSYLEKNQQSILAHFSKSDLTAKVAEFIDSAFTVNPRILKFELMNKIHNAIAGEFANKIIDADTTDVPLSIDRKYIHLKCVTDLAIMLSNMEPDSKMIALLKSRSQALVQFDIVVPADKMLSREEIKSIFDFNGRVMFCYGIEDSSTGAFISMLEYLGYFDRFNDIAKDYQLHEMAAKETFALKISIDILRFILQKYSDFDSLVEAIIFLFHWHGNKLLEKQFMYRTVVALARNSGKVTAKDGVEEIMFDLYKENVQKLLSIMSGNFVSSTF